MDNEIKAIQTTYNGYKFRSRLEARWAVFFDSLSIEYEYEPEGFHTGGRCYLPDFFLPAFNIYIEVKPDTEDALEKIKKPVSMLVPDSKFDRILILSKIPTDYDGSNYVFPCYKKEKDYDGDEHLYACWYSFSSFEGYYDEERSCIAVPIDKDFVSWEYMNYKYDEIVAVTLVHENMTAGHRTVEDVRQNPVSYSTVNKVLGKESHAYSKQEKYNCSEYLQNEAVYQAFRNASSARFEYGEEPCTEIDSSTVSIRKPIKFDWKGRRG